MAHVTKVLVLLLIAASVACGSSSGASDDEVSAALRNGEIGITSAEGPGVLMLRYVLHERYGLDVGKDVTLVESTADSIADQLIDGEIDAASVSQVAAYEVHRRDGLKILVPVSEEMHDITGAPFAASLIVSYRDVVERKPAALAELDRLFDASLTYWNANRGRVLDDIAAQTRADPAYLDWWWRHFDLPIGDLSSDTQRGILAAWQAAAALGDIETFPDLSGMLREGSSGDATPIPSGVRETVSLAVLDDPAHRAVLYALERSLVDSSTVDVSVTYLPLAALTEAASTGQYDVIEAPTLTVAVGPSNGVNFVVLSAGLRDLSGTVLVIASRS